MRRALILAGLLVLLSPAEALAETPAEDGGIAGVFERDAVEVEAPAGLSIAEVRIDNRLGDVSIRGHDRESIIIQSFKRAEEPETLERLVVSLVPNGQGQVQVSTSLRAGAEYRPVRAGSIAVDLVVFVPRQAAIDAEVWRGTLRLSKVDNGANLVVDKGQVDVRQVSGTVVSNIRDGQQDFAELFGELDARSIKGKLSLKTVQGKRLAASVVRGSIDGTGVKVEEIAVRSIFGNIKLVAEFVPGGRYKVSSRRGDVSLRFHGSTPVDLEVQAMKAMLGPELGMEEAAARHWKGHFGPMKRLAADHVLAHLPAHLEVRSETGQVLVKHF